MLRWINPLHYENSKQLLVFHTQDLDRNSSLLKKEQKDFKIFFQGIDQKIKEARRLKPYEKHPYWLHDVKRIFLRRTTQFLENLTRKIVDLKHPLFRFNTFFLFGKKDPLFLNTAKKASKFNTLDHLKQNYIFDKNIYVDFEIYLSDRQKVESIALRNKVYLYSLNYPSEDAFSKSLQYRDVSLHFIVDNKMYKSFLFDIYFLFFDKPFQSLITENRRRKKAVAAFKVILFSIPKLILKRRKDPYPYFAIFEFQKEKEKEKRINYKSKDVPIIFTAPIWGDRYVDIFLSYSLKSQLSPNNIPALESLQDCEYNIFTLPVHKERIQTSEAFAYLSRIMNVNIYCLLKYTQHCDEKYKIKSMVYGDSLERGRISHKANAFFNADIIFSDGFISKSQKILSDFRTIEVIGPRVDEQKFSQYLTDYERKKVFYGNGLEKNPIEIDRRFISFPSDKLSALAGTFLHNICDNHVFKHSNDIFHPSHVYWRAGANGIVANGFHLYPIFFRGGDDIKNDFLSTIDDDLILTSNIGFKERFFATDAHQMFCCELSPRIDRESYNVNCTSRMIDAYGFYNGHNALSWRLEHFMIPHIFGNLETPKEEWEKALERSRTFTQMVRNNAKFL